MVILFNYFFTKYLLDSVPKDVKYDRKRILFVHLSQKQDKKRFETLQKIIIFKN